MVISLSSFYSAIIVAYLLKISLPSEKNNVFKSSSIEVRGHKCSGTNCFGHIFCSFHPLQIDKMIVFDNLI